MKIRLFKVRLNQGGYDSTGTYWGTGTPLWCAQSEDETEMILIQNYHFRASSREEAKQHIRANYPNATFYR
jgi:hypothetical protein